jgi:threonine synthase
MIEGDLYFSVPSGNFGNLIAGLYAWKFGMPVNGFIAAMNRNNALGGWLRGGSFVPRTAAATRSPALDIANPANFERLAAFYTENPAVMKNMVFPAVSGDAETLAAMEKIYRRYGQIVDPHTAVGFAAAEQFAAQAEPGSHTVLLSTGHPAKEAAAVLEATGQNQKIPYSLALLREEAEPVARIAPDLEALESAIASCL